MGTCRESCLLGPDVLVLLSDEVHVVVEFSGWVASMHIIDSVHCIHFVLVIEGINVYGGGEGASHVACFGLIVSKVLCFLELHSSRKLLLM